MPVASLHRHPIAQCGRSWQRRSGTSQSVRPCGIGRVGSAKWDRPSGIGPSGIGPARRLRRGPRYWHARASPGARCCARARRLFPTNRCILAHTNADIPHDERHGPVHPGRNAREPVLLQLLPSAGPPTSAATSAPGPSQICSTPPRTASQARTRNDAAATLASRRLSSGMRPVRRRVRSKPRQVLLHMRRDRAPSVRRRLGLFEVPVRMRAPSVWKHNTTGAYAVLYGKRRSHMVLCSAYGAPEDTLARIREGSVYGTPGY